MPDEQEIEDITTPEGTETSSPDDVDSDIDAETVISGDAETNQDEEIPHEEIANNLEDFGDIKLDFTAILGKINMPIEQFLKLNRGAILELDKGKDSLIDVFVNDKYIARGDIRIVNETKIGVEIKEPPIIEL